ncbi:MULTISPECIES: FtsW/RodA/SpoVE family cell cycle protein [unclassified Streptomyces]|uniref:FtsW/RodA/SpoVE family cell cycle protein n=1 Tax=unclassified Streptomyces TaxID=2593676 RepID=UPI00224F8D5E|nr:MULTISPECIES: FtsW/RodA/SpoVE family cell cycle protein [unclassified Streptomyces]MCX5012253.1 FtsW/RodA/SpoVE family cell cycle protein [Streptomyces sp. NBC_00555]MCX5606216.1 FtsW/RodA/SpoVE family cell cycle protein [Streptomyces sp. NBC_00047]
MRGLKPLTTAGSRRRTEAMLLVLVLVIAVFGHAAAGLAMNDELPPNLTGFTISMTLLSLVGHLGIRRFAAYADPLVFPLAMLLTGLGLVLIHRLDQGYIERYGSDANAPGQLMWTVVGVAACIAVVALLRDHRLLQRFIYITMAVALVLLIAPAFSPADTYGAKRWIILFGFSLQPGEFVKIMIAIFFAGYLVIHRDSLALTGRKFLGMRLPPMRQLGPIVTVWIVSMLVLVFERDLGTSLIFFGVFVVMLYVATERTSWIVCGLFMAAAGAFVVGSTEPHVKARVAAWLDPLSVYWPTPPPGITSDQSAQALFSFGTGGISGTGLGMGNPELIKFAGRSDFILTTVGEELGLAGVMAVLILYALLVQRGLRMALAARDPFGKLLAVGLASALALQVFVVAGGVTGLIPLTGKALPFLAKGGSSLLANWIMVALLLRISDSAERQREADARGPVETTITPTVSAA